MINRNCTFHGRFAENLLLLRATLVCFLLVISGNVFGLSEKNFAEKRCQMSFVSTVSEYRVSRDNFMRSNGNDYSYGARYQCLFHQHGVLSFDSVSKFDLLMAESKMIDKSQLYYQHTLNSLRQFTDKLFFGREAKNFTMGVNIFSLEVNIIVKF